MQPAELCGCSIEMEEYPMDVHSTCVTPASSRMFRKRRHSPSRNLRYVKRRFSSLRPEDISLVTEPTHYLRVIFHSPNTWYIRSGHDLDSVHKWLKPYGGIPVNEYHITLALLSLSEQHLAMDISPIAIFLRNVRFELFDFTLLRKTLALKASEICCDNLHRFQPITRVNMALPLIKEWLRVQGFPIYNSHLPLHMSVSKLHALDDNTCEYVANMSCFKQYPTQMFVRPIAVELVSIRQSSNAPRCIVHSVPILHAPGF
ncbi:ORF4b protein [Bat coronavirus]|uniref:ORF4b protein n=1 Tax=Bat coronavirus TaxID=1508220 RepID=UPI000A17E8E5|nr:ORF4b protein [Bat coronavirus]ARJ34229.1 ORF4b protein [Bat coronavirus]